MGLAGLLWAIPVASGASRLIGSIWQRSVKLQILLEIFFKKKDLLCANNGVLVAKNSACLGNIILPKENDF